jgi:hypothetical protein
VLRHTETLLAAVRHSITNESCAAHFLHPTAATGGASPKSRSERKDNPDRQKARGWEAGLRERNAAVRRTEKDKITKLDQDQVACLMDRRRASASPFGRSAPHHLRLLDLH